MPNRDFIEDYPLYRKFVEEFPEYTHELSSPSVRLKCELCGSEQTFALANDYDQRHHSGRLTGGLVFRAVYQCAGCRQTEYEFFLRISEDRSSIVKVGQYPGWEIKTDKNLADLLGHHSPIYRKGLVCESQGYGIGAYAYYRRIVEEIIDELLKTISGLIDPAELEKYQAALRDVQKETVTEKKIALVKDLLPPILRPQGNNPLSLLHGLLSEGLHGRTDEECLEDAAHIRDTLVFLVNQVILSKSSAKLFTDSMKKLLEKNSARSSKPKTG